MPSLLKSSIGIILLLFSFVELKAQDYLFKHYKFLNSNYEQKINFVFQDKSGLILFGTQSGLYGYDGINYHKISVGTEDTSMEITAMCSTGKGEYYVSNAKGQLFLLSNNSSNFYSVRFNLLNWEEGFPKAKINKLLYSKSGVLWISTYGEGLYYYNNNRLYNINTDDGINSNDIYDIILDSEDNIWAASDQGLNKIKIEKGKKIINSIDQSNSDIPDNLVLCLSYDSKQNRIYGGTYSGGIFSVDLNEKNIIRIPEPLKDANLNEITSLLVFDGLVWVGTNGKGLFSFADKEGGSLLSYNNPKGLSFNRIKYILGDREGNVWLIGPDFEFAITSRRHFFINKIENEELKAITEVFIDKTNRLFFAYEKGLGQIDLSKPNGSFKQILGNKELDNIPIISLNELNDSVLLAGSFGKGLFIINKKSGKIIKRLEYKNTLVNDNILDIEVDKEYVYLASLGGLQILNHQLESVNIEIPKPLNQSFIYSLLKSGDELWIGIDGAGLWSFKKGTFKKQEAQILSKVKTIYSIEKSGNYIWFSSPDIGLLFKKGDDSIKEFVNNNDLFGIKFSSIVGIGNGAVLLIHNNYVELIDIEKRAYRPFKLRNENFELTANLNSAYKDINGAVWVGSEQGLYRFRDSDSLFINTPKALISSMEVFLEPINTKDEIKLAHNRNHITFRFPAFWYQDPDLIRYQIKLEGYDDDYIFTRNHFATYANLRPGKYIFKVRVSILSNSDFYEETEIAFKIEKPFYQQFWFISALISFLFVLAFLLIKARENRLKKEKDQQKNYLEMQLEILRNQVNPHFLFNSLNALNALIEIDPKTAVSYVEHLADFYRNVLSYRDKKLISLQEEIELLKHYLFLQEKRFGKNLVVEINIGKEIGTLNIPPLSLQILCENAIKHNVISNRSPLKIEINFDGKYLEVKNNINEKSERVDSTGLGLKNLNEKYHLLNKSLPIIINNGKYFIVSLELLNE